MYCKSIDTFCFSEEIRKLILESGESMVCIMTKLILFVVSTLILSVSQLEIIGEDYWETVGWYSACPNFVLYHLLTIKGCTPNDVFFSFSHSYSSQNLPPLTYNNIISLKKEILNNILNLQKEISTNQIGKLIYYKSNNP